MAVYQKNLDDGVMDVIEASKEAQALLAFMAERQEWQGTATDLWKAVVPGASDDPPRVGPSWPQSGRGMTGTLTRIAQPLRQIGIHYEHLPRADSKGTRRLRVWKVTAQPSEPPVRQKPGQNLGGMRVPGSDGSKGSDDPIVRESGNRQRPSEKIPNEFNATDVTDVTDGLAGTLHDSDGEVF